MSLPIRSELARGRALWWTLPIIAAMLGVAAVAMPAIAALVLGTFVSEDLTCIAAGLLIRDGSLGWVPGIAGCLLGIFLGDIGLWMIGRLAGRGVLRWSWVQRHLTEANLDRVSRWLDRRGWLAVLAARFLPGTRLPLYLAAGMLGRSGDRFALWTFVAALVWTPLLVGGVAAVGPEIVGPLRERLGAGVWAVVVAAGLLYLGVKASVAKLSPGFRMRLAVRIAKLRRWEFWPAWIFYLPLVPWIGWLMLRHRGVTVWTAANPGIPDGGVVGESKFDILAKLPSESIVPSALIAPGPDRMRRFEEIASERRWSFPLILKPDVGQRGSGVKLVRSNADIAAYLEGRTDAIVVQTYHPGPYEAGVFYMRMPSEPRGRIFSITDKRFPILVGDGHSTVEQLIWSHSRFRMQAGTFLTRHAREIDRVLADGETLPLTIAGNHCQGTLFLDGTRLITPELERRFDEIARQTDGFFFGRFDVRYADVDRFRLGLGFGIVELNGVTSESTNLYDPAKSLVSAYRILFTQWSLLFRIGAANRRLGHRPTSFRRLARLVFAHFRTVSAPSA